MIKSIKIKNFRSIENLEWTFDAKNPINVLLGKNGIGKSSMISAIRFALTGEANREDVSDAADCATVTVTLDDDSTFSRTIYAVDKPSKVTINGKNGTAKVLAEKLETHFGVSPADMKFVSAKEIGAVKSTDFGDFIGKFLPDKLKAEDVLKAASHLSKSQRDILEMFLPAEFALPELDEVYDTVFNIRKAKKQDLKTLEAKSKFEGALPKRTLADIDNALTKIAVDEARISEYTKTLNNYEASLRKKEAHDNEIATLEKTVEGMKVTKPSEVIEVVTTKEKSSALSEIATINGTINTLKANVTSFQKILTNLSASKCPLSDLIVCTTDKTSAREEIEKSVNDTNLQIADCEKKIVELQEKVKDCDSRLASYKTQYADYQKKKELLIRLDVLKKNVPTVLEKPAPVASAEDTAELKTKLNAEKAQITLYNESVKAASIISTLNQEINDLTVVIENLSPKGEIKREITATYLSFFEDEINALAVKVNPDYEFHFSAENGFTFYFRTNKASRPRNYAFLSQGEKVICDLILLLFCSKFSGTGIIFVDNLNDLDADNIKAVLALIASLETSEYPMAFIAAVDTAEIRNALAGLPVKMIF